MDTVPEHEANRPAGSNSGEPRCFLITPEFYKGVRSFGGATLSNGSHIRWNESEAISASGSTAGSSIARKGTHAPRRTCQSVTASDSIRNPGGDRKQTRASGGHYVSRDN